MQHSSMLVHQRLSHQPVLQKVLLTPCIPCSIQPDIRTVAKMSFTFQSALGMLLSRQERVMSPSHSRRAPSGVPEARSSRSSQTIHCKHALHQRHSCQTQQPAVSVVVAPACCWMQQHYMICCSSPLWRTLLHWRLPSQPPQACLHQGLRVQEARNTTQAGGSSRTLLLLCLALLPV